MKKILLLSLFIFITTHISLWSQTGYALAHWDFNGQSGATSVKSVYIGGGLSTVSPSSYTKFGTGVIPVSWYTGNGFTCRGTSATLAEAIANNQYISFTLTPTTTTGINITSISFTAFTQNQNRSFALLSNVSGFGLNNLIQTTENVSSGTRLTYATPGHVNLTNPIEFRVYVYGVNDMWESFGLGQRPATENYDLSIFGLIPDNAAPTKPTNLSSSNITTAYFDLKWDASSDNLGVTEYEIFKNGVLAGTSKTNSYKVTNLSKATTYSFTVKAKDAFGNVSSESDPIIVTTSNIAIAKHKMGINPYFAQDFITDLAFADVMVTAREWLVGDYNAHIKAPVDANGWPTTDASVVAWAGVNNMYGTYKMKFTGQVSRIACGWGTARIENMNYNASTNTTTCDLIYEGNDIGSGLYLGFEGTNGGVKDVKLMRPLFPGSTSSYSFDTKFTNQFKNIISKFSTIRFLDWSVANSSQEVNWADRIKPGYHRFSFTWGYPVAWESMIDLCNETNCDAWINIPFKATDDYVTQLAQLWKDRLNPNLNVYVEFSNELWNFAGGFQQGSQNHQAAIAEVESGNTNLNFDGETNIWPLAFRRVAQQIVRVSNIFRSVWGDSNMMTRVRPALMWQQGDGQNIASEQVLWLDYYSNLTNKPINYYLYGAGGSAYYYPDNFSKTLTLDNFWTSETNSVENWRANNHADISLATALGCKRIAYEGGPSYDPCFEPGGCSEAVKEAAWSDPRIKQSIIDHHNMWSEYGGELLCYYSSTGGYQWGFAKTSHDLNTYKYQAIDELNNVDKMPVVVGFDGPFTTDGNNSDYGFPSGASRSSGTALLSRYGAWRSYMFRSDSTSYNISVNYTGASGSALQIMLDGAVIYNAIVTGSGATPKINLNVNAGLHSIKVRLNNNNPIGIQQIALAHGTAVTTTVNTKASTSQLRIYPGVIQRGQPLSLYSDFNGDCEFSIYDLAGSLIHSSKINMKNGSASLIASFAKKPGLYIAKLKQADCILSEKIIVK